MYHCPYCKQTYKVLNRCPKKVCQAQLMKDHRPGPPPVLPPERRPASMLRTPGHPSREDREDHDGLAFATGVAAGAALSSVFDDSDDSSRRDDSNYDGGGGDFGGGGSSGGWDD